MMNEVENFDKYQMFWSCVGQRQNPLFCQSAQLFFGQSDLLSRQRDRIFWVKVIDFFGQSDRPFGLK
jgi:hypothetical protein